MPFLDYCDIDELEDDLIHIHAKSLKLYTDNEWEDLCSEVRKLSDFHIIEIGEDGQVTEDYGDEPLFDWSVEVHLPSSELGKFNIESNFTYSSLVDYLSLVLPSDYYKMVPHNLGTGILIGSASCTDMHIFPTEHDTAYLRFSKKAVPILDYITKRFNIVEKKRTDGCIGYEVESVLPTKLSWENESDS